jgi:hypothetical protein
MRWATSNSIWELESNDCTKICFSSSFDGDTWRDIRDLCCSPQPGTSALMDQLIALLRGTNSAPFGQALGQFLRPVLNGLPDGQHSQRRHIFIDLYIPNTPIDPAAIQYWSSREYRLHPLVRAPPPEPPCSYGKAHRTRVSKRHGTGALAIISSKSPAPLVTLVPHLRHAPQRLRIFKQAPTRPAPT